MENDTRIDPATRAAFFAQATRQNWQMLPSLTGSEGGTVQFALPKVRLLSKIRLMVEAVLTATHASSTSYTPGTYAPYEFLKRVQVEINNGFTPFNLSGRDLYFYNLVRGDASVLSVETSGRGKAVQGVTASSSGTANTVRFVVDMPIALNDRDPIGLILLQNEETVVTVTIDIDTAAKLAPAESGYTFAVSDIKITPFVETFSVPAVKEARPDLSILKLVHSKKETISATGVHTLALPTGQTYRKLLVYIEDSSGGEADSDISGNFELIFNQADRPYLISPAVLAAINHEQFAYTLPQGLYVFDFSYQGVSNYGGSRDWIDTERLTEFWFRFTAASPGSITAIYETLSALRTA